MFFMVRTSFFSRHIGQITPENIYLYDLKKSFLDQSIQRIFYFILKMEALVRTKACIQGCRRWTAGGEEGVAFLR